MEKKMKLNEPKEFADFWAVWPKRVKRQEAVDAFRWAMAHHNEDGHLLDRMLVTIAWQQTFYGGPKWLPDAPKWLLNRRWEDENPAVVVVAGHEAARAEERARVAEREKRYEEWQAAQARRHA